MKPIFILLLFLNALPGSSMIFQKSHSSHAITCDTSKMKETLAYYKNGNLKYRTLTLFDDNGIETKTTSEVYRKDGRARYTYVSENGQLLNYAKYNKKGKILYERSYIYNFNGFLVSIETKRDGERRVRNFDMDIYGNPVE